MIDFTRFLKLKKPDKSEFYNVELNNENLDSIDEVLKKVAAQMSDKAAGNPQTGAALNAEMLGNKIPREFETLSALPILDSGIDLDTLKAPCAYGLSYNAYVNMPTAEGGTISVRYGNGTSVYLVQEYVSVSARKFARYIQPNSRWSGWMELATTESGTWNISIIGSDGGAPTYATREGVFTRSGKSVTVSGIAKISSKGNLAGNLKLSGLPFAIKLASLPVTVLVDYLQLTDGFFPNNVGSNSQGGTVSLTKLWLQGFIPLVANDITDKFEVRINAS